MATRSSGKKGAAASKDMVEDSSEGQNKRAAEGLLEKKEKKSYKKDTCDAMKQVYDSTCALL